MDKLYVYMWKEHTKIKLEKDCEKVQVKPWEVVKSNREKEFLTSNWFKEVWVETFQNAQTRLSYLDDKRTQIDSEFEVKYNEAKQNYQQKIKEIQLLKEKEQKAIDIEEKVLNWLLNKIEWTIDVKLQKAKESYEEVKKDVEDFKKNKEYKEEYTYDELVVLYTKEFWKKPHPKAKKETLLAKLWL